MSRTRTRSTIPTQVNLLLRALVIGAGLLLSSCATSLPLKSRTFFVVPLILPDGTPSEPQCALLESWLLNRAGGFTDLGVVRGAWMDPDGQIIEEENHAYLVSVSNNPEQFENALRYLIINEFQQQEAYVERW